MIFLFRKMKNSKRNYIIETKNVDHNQKLQTISTIYRKRF